MPNGGGGGNSISRAASKVVVSATVSLGAETGKNLGTILQLRRSQSHQIVAAVGVPQFYNHYVRNNTRMLHVHGRTANEDAFTVQELGEPRNDYPRYHVFAFDGELIDGTNREVYDADEDEWVPLPNPWHGATFDSGEQINYAQRIDGEVYLSTDKGLFYDGVRIVSHPGSTYRSSNGASLVYDGLLFANWDDGTLRVYEWTPGGAVGSPINSFSLISGHFIRAFGILDGTVYAVSGYGRFIRYDRGLNTWSYVTQPESVAEFYCLMGMFNKLRLGDYPNGHMWDYASGGSLSRLSSYPPVESGASSLNREVQAAALYGGDEICHTWPWGVVHRRDMATGTWYDQRLYTAPSVSTAEAPYIGSFGHNKWGQRLPCAALFRDGVVISAAPKDGNLLDTDYASVPNRSEYGKVWMLRRPHAFSCELDWKSGNTVITLEISAEGIVLRQDDVELGRVDGFAPSDFEGDDAITVEFGDGLYGPLDADLIGHTIDQQF